MERINFKDPNKIPARAVFRFYEELNFFLPQKWQKCDFEYTFKGKPAIKDTVEAIGVPHTEVEILLVNGQSVGFDYQLKDGDRVSVYPMFESLNISSLIKLRQKPLRNPKFICDVHLGKLATILRLLGFDTSYRNNYDDPEIISIAQKEHRIILTCDRGLLKNRTVTHGHCLHSRVATEQAREIIDRFDLRNIAQPFSRCTVCNAKIYPVEKAEIYELLPEKVRENYREFKRCTGCLRIYWQGTHYNKINATIKTLIRSDLEF